MADTNRIVSLRCWLGVFAGLLCMVSAAEASNRTHLHAKTSPCQASCKFPKKCLPYMNTTACRDSCFRGRCGVYEQCAQVDCPSEPCNDTVYCFPKFPPLEQLDPTLLPPSSVNASGSSLSGTPTVFCNGAPCKSFQECVDDGSLQYCADYCVPERCPEGKTCQLEISTCISPDIPCPPTAICL